MPSTMGFQFVSVFFILLDLLASCNSIYAPPDLLDLKAFGFESLEGLRRPLNPFWNRRDPVSFYTKSWTLSSPYAWIEEYYEGMPIDHFAFADARNFSLRYLLNYKHFSNNGPIFFYTGNEGDIEGFALNTGFMWDIAEEFGAAIVFAEHRFYGKSLPFGKESFQSVNNLGYLGSEQALADYAELIDYLKTNRLKNARNSPVIAFGGSYGGMLAAWARIKYPQHFAGAIAASAPLLWFIDVPERPGENYYNIVTRTYKLGGCNLESMFQSFSAIKKLAQDANGRKFINENFRLEKKSHLNSSSDADSLIAGIQSVMEAMAMVDYPYEATFLATLPPWVVQNVCKYFTSKIKKSPEDYALASFEVLNLFYNYTGQTETLCIIGSECPDAFSQLGADIWNWQVCTEMVMPLCSIGPPSSIFPKNCPFIEKAALDSCRNVYRSKGYKDAMFRPRWAIINYGKQFSMATNIVFSNGYLDPWSGGGWKLEPATEGTLVSLIVEDGAHHYDLRGSHPNDTAGVKRVRLIEKEHIRRWIEEASGYSKRAKTRKSHSMRQKHRHR